MSEYGRHSVLIPKGTVIFGGPAYHLEPHDTLAAEDEEVTPGLLSEVKNIGIETMRLVKGAIDPEVMDMDTFGLFNELPELALTRLESRHGVTFGQLVVRSLDGDERAEIAAYKPLDTAKEVAHEFSLSRYFMGAGKSHGFRTFVPMGILRETDGTYALLTKYEHGVRSLDNELWNDEVEPDAPVVGRALGKCAYVAAAIAAAGWTFADLQPKNVFVSNYEEVFVGDLETMHPFPQRGGEVDEEEVAHRVAANLSTLVSNMFAKRGDGASVPEQFRNNFALIYTGIVRSPHSMVPPDARPSFSQVLEYFEAA